MVMNLQLRSFLSLFVLCLFQYFVCGQSTAYHQAISWLKENKIRLNSPTPPDGFHKYIDCDSNVVYKKLTGDTIIFYTGTPTPSPLPFEYFKRFRSEPFFNIT